MTKRTTKSPKATSETLLDALLGTLQYGHKELQLELESIVKGTAVENGHDKGSRIAFLMVQVGKLADQVRKIEAAKAKRFTELTLTEIAAWLRQATPEDRARVARELHSMERRGGGVLGA